MLHVQLAILADIFTTLCLYILKNLYVLVRLIHAVRTHVFSSQTMQYLPIYLRFTTPGELAIKNFHFWKYPWPTRDPTRQNPYPWPRVRVFAGTGTGSAGIPQGYPRQSLGPKRRVASLGLPSSLRWPLLASVNVLACAGRHWPSLAMSESAVMKCLVSKI